VGTNEKKRLEAKRPVNRGLLVVVFGVTGMASLFFWWRGIQLRNPRQPISNVEIKINNGEDNKKNTKQDKLVESIRDLVATASGRYAVYVYQLTDKTGFGMNETERMPAASIMKIPVMTAVMQKVDTGELTLDQTYTLEGADRATGSGPLQFKTAGTSYTIDELLGYLGRNSDNTAWVMFNRRLGVKTMEDEVARLGMKDSSYDDLVITAADAARMFEDIYEDRKQLFSYLTGSIYEDRIPVGLAGTGVQIIHKVGTDTGVWADVGIIQSTKPFILAILNENVKREEAQIIVPEIAKLVWGFEKTL
jgi:beta-lactamase class A